MEMLWEDLRGYRERILEEDDLKKAAHCSRIIPHYRGSVNIGSGNHPPIGRAARIPLPCLLHPEAIEQRGKGLVGMNAADAFRQYGRYGEHLDFINLFFIQNGSDWYS